LADIQRDLADIKTSIPLVDRFFEDSPLSTLRRLIDIRGDIDALQQFNRNTNESVNKDLNELKKSIAVVDKFFAAVKLNVVPIEVEKTR
jgi:hypothetical protein